MRLLIDSREPWPHPWAPHFSADVRLERDTLETGDVALSAIPDGAVVERKTVSDLLCCIGNGRERFERELKRSRYCGRLLVIVEGALVEVLRETRSIHPNAIIGTLAAWQRRYAPFCFAGSVQTAAQMAESFLRGQVREVTRSAKTVARADRSSDAPEPEEVAPHKKGLTT
jgi:DNA excision repair protein ERCC-4